MVFLSRPAARSLAVLTALLFAASLNLPGATLSGTAQTVFPASTHQVFSLDYQRIMNDPAAQQVEQQVMPPQMLGISAILTLGEVKPTDLNRLTFASYTDKTRSDIIGVAEGNFLHFNTARFFTKTAKQPTPPQIQGVTVYTSGDLTFFLPDTSSLVFGSHAAIEAAIGAQSGALPRLSNNPEVSGLVAGTKTSDVWSILDSDGSRGMVHGLIGGSIAGIDTSIIDKHFGGSRYTIDFGSDIQVNMQLDLTDSVSAALVSNGLAVAIATREKQETSPAAKAMLEGVTSDASGDAVFLQFTVAENNVPALLKTDLLRSIAH